MSNKQWSVYLLRCADNSLYTGITTDVARRLEEHNTGEGLAAKYTRSRRPVVLVYCEPVASRSEAARREAEIKRLRKASKEALISRQSC